MEADTPTPGDISERPVFVNISDNPDDLEAEEERTDYLTRIVFKTQPSHTRTQAECHGKRTQTAQSSTHKPSCASRTVTREKEGRLEVYISGVKAGAIVMHKAFGIGQVQGMTGRGLL